MRTESWKHLALVALASATVLLAVAPLARAQSTADPQNPVVKKYLTVDKFGHVTGIISEQYKMVMTSMDNTCRKNLLGCDLGIEAIKGNPDPKYKEIFKDLALIQKKGNDRKWMFGDEVIDVFPLGLVLWNPDEAAKILTGKISSAEKLGLIAGGKKKIYEALWHLGDPKSFDAMAQWFHDIGYTDMHTKNTLMVLNTWPLSAEQKKKVEDFCLNMFQGKGAIPEGQRREKEIVKPCLRWLGLSASKNGEVIEFVENLLGSDTADAARALGGMGYKKAKSALQEVLAKQKKEKKVKKKKVTIWYPRNESVAAAVALIGMGDKDAEKAIKSWVAVDKKEKRLEDTSGFEMTFFEAPWASEAALKKLLPLLKKSFKEVEKLGKGNDSIKLYAVRAAIALAQCGQKDGMGLLLDTLKGNNKDHRDEVLKGLGGHNNYFGTYRTGIGGLNVTVKKGIGKKEVDGLEKMIFSRLKFWSERGVKETAMRAVLDMRARVKMATAK